MSVSVQTFLHASLLLCSAVVLAFAAQAVPDAKDKASLVCAWATDVDRPSAAVAPAAGHLRGGCDSDEVRQLAANAQVVATIYAAAAIVYTLTSLAFYLRRVGLPPRQGPGGGRRCSDAAALPAGAWFAPLNAGLAVLGLAAAATAAQFSRFLSSTTGVCVGGGWAAAVGLALAVACLGHVANVVGAAAGSGAADKERNAWRQFDNPPSSAPDVDLGAGGGVSPAANVTDSADTVDAAIAPHGASTSAAAAFMRPAKALQVKLGAALSGQESRLRIPSARNYPASPIDVDLHFSDMGALEPARPAIGAESVAVGNHI